MGEKGRKEMTEETNWKQFLTEEVLKECWDADKRPGGDLPNRTFDNRNDMMDLYEETKKAEKWEAFTIYSNNIWWKENAKLYYNCVEQTIANYNAWLFCLGNEDYEGMCKLVAEFYGWKENK